MYVRKREICTYVSAPAGLGARVESRQRDAQLAATTGRLAAGYEDDYLHMHTAAAAFIGRG